MKNYNEYFQDIIVFKDCNKYGLTFETNCKKYFYDTGTNKVFECNIVEYEILKYILEKSTLNDIDSIGLKEEIELGLKNIREMIITEHLFYNGTYTKFSTEYEDTTECEISQIILELTEDCNLRCSYCIYDEETDKFRTWSKAHMTFDIACKAIDYAFAHSKDKLAITFYGGEPLLQYNLMKECIEYTLKKGQGKKITFGFTTNLTLMTREKAEYFSSLDFCSITGSIDGPEEIHDENRITVNRQGSHSKAIQGLKTLIDVYGQEKAKQLININTVIAPPYTQAKINKVHSYFNTLEWLPEGMIITNSYVDEAQSETTPEKIQYAKEFYSKPLEITDPISYCKLKRICSDEKDRINFGDNARLTKIHNRMIVDEPIPFVAQNGCCRPGSRRLYVTTQGEFKVCERIGNSPSIGSVNGGIDYSAINKYYVEDYCKASIGYCNSCWAKHLCSLCFVSFYNDNGINIDRKQQVCYAQRCRLRNDLIMYHQLMEEYPEYIELIDKIKLE